MARSSSTGALCTGFTLVLLLCISIYIDLFLQLLNVGKTNFMWWCCFSNQTNIWVELRINRHSTQEIGCCHLTPNSTPPPMWSTPYVKWNLRKISWTLGQYFHNECFHESNCVLQWCCSWINCTQLLGQFILGQNNFRVFKSSMTTFVVCHFMAILDVRILTIQWQTGRWMPFCHSFCRHQNGCC